MGIPMDDIHTPMVAAGPTSASSRPDVDTSNLSLSELFDAKEKLEAELKALGEVLESRGVNMSTSLTTFDGYPRDDIDVAQIRTTRARIIRLRNDHKDIMNKVEQGIHAHFASIQQRPDRVPQAPVQPSQESTQPPAIVEGTDASQAGLVETPFAKVNSVVEGSPAAQAGLKVGDKIRSFGNVSWINHENLSKVAEVVQRNEGNPVLVKIARRNEDGQGVTNLSLRLVPRRNWGGRGLLGCHLVLA